MKSIFAPTPRSHRNRQSPPHPAEPQSFFSPTHEQSKTAGASFFPPAIQRLATPDEEKMPGTNDARMREDKMIQEKPEVQHIGGQEEDEMLQGKAENGAGLASAQVSSQIESSQGQGQPLPENTREEMEAGIGTDFSEVKVHTDPGAAALNRALDAQAFTYGHDMYFGEGKFSPGTSKGDRLLAHELVHVGQQTEGLNRQIMRRPLTELERKQFESDQRFELMAHELAYQDNPPKSIGKFEISTGLSHETGQQTGFQALSFIHVGQLVNPVIAFRGTEELKDVTTDLNPFGIGMGQYMANKLRIKQEIERLKEKSPTKKVDLTGHSLGGALAQMAAADNAASIGRVVTFQAAGVQKAYVDKMAAHNKKAKQKVASTHYRKEGDLVPLGGAGFTEGDIYEVHREKTAIDDPRTWILSPLIPLVSVGKGAASHTDFPVKEAIKNPNAQIDHRKTTVPNNMPRTTEIVRQNLGIYLAPVYYNAKATYASLSFAANYLMTAGQIVQKQADATFTPVFDRFVKSLVWLENKLKGSATQSWGMIIYGKGDGRDSTATKASNGAKIMGSFDYAKFMEDIELIMSVIPAGTKYRDILHDMKDELNAKEVDKAAAYIFKVVKETTELLEKKKPKAPSKPATVAKAGPPLHGAVRNNTAGRPESRKAVSPVPLVPAKTPLKPTKDTTTKQPATQKPDLVKDQYVYSDASNVYFRKVYYSGKVEYLLVNRQSGLSTKQPRLNLPWRNVKDPAPPPEEIPMVEDLPTGNEMVLKETYKNGTIKYYRLGDHYEKIPISKEKALEIGKGWWYFP